MWKYGIKQHDLRDCGAACLASICEFYGLKVPLVKIRECLKVNKNGASLYAMSKTAEHLRFSAEVLEGDFTELAAGVISGEITLPAILHVVNENHYGHYIILRKVNGDKITVFDPAKGDQIYSKSEFVDIWTGYIISMNITKEFQKRNDRITLYIKYIKIFNQQKKALLLILFVSLILIAITVLSALAYQRVIDVFILKNTVDEMTYNGDSESMALIMNQVFLVLNNFHYLFLSLIILYLVQMLLNFLKGILSARISKRVNGKLVNMFIEKLMHLPVTFFEDRDTGEILSRFLDINEINQIISETAITLIINFIMVVVSGAVLFSISINLFLLSLLLILLYAIIVFAFKSKIKDTNQNILEKNSKLVSSLKETSDNINDIKNFCGEVVRLKSLKKKNSELLNYVYKGNRIWAIQNTFLSGVSGIGALIIMSLGSLLTIHEIITLGSLIAFTGLLQFFIEPFQQIIEMQMNIQGAAVAMERLNDILEISSEKELFGGEHTFDFRNVDIIFENVSFGYGYDEPILTDINLTIKGGRKYAIIGESGCGKTTLVRLLVHFYKCSNGHIFFGNTDINEISTKIIRSKIKYVSQDIRLFAGSILDNLCSFKENPSEDKLLKIMEGCRVKEIIEALPFGIHTRISEGGLELSVGQRQRIKLAQVLITEPDILILDEITSNLDEECEKDVFRFILDFCEGITCIFIMHNRKLAYSCEEILMMRKGRVVEQIVNSGV